MMSWLLNNPIGDRWNETVRHFAELYEREALKSTLTKEQLFEIASVLVRSNCSSYIKLGIDILEHLSTSVDSNVVHKSYLIYLAIAYIRLRTYDLANNCLKLLKSFDPNNRQAIELEACLQKHELNTKFKGTLSSIKLTEDGEEEEDPLQAELNCYLNSTQDYANQTL